VRPAPFSTYRPGFELRTYRRCRRALLFHQFRGEPGVGESSLVQSTNPRYRDENALDDALFPLYSFLAAVTPVCYRRDGDGYMVRSLPPVGFEYSRPGTRSEVQVVDPESLDSLSEMPYGRRFRWMDLHGEGLAGGMSDAGGAWTYKCNPTGVGALLDTAAPLQLDDVGDIFLFYRYDAPQRDHDLRAWEARPWRMTPVDQASDGRSEDLRTLRGGVDRGTRGASGT
jgi:hypothetical protein